MKLKRLTVPRVEEDKEEIELSYTTGGSVKWCIY
jgi:hypothetical protein